MVTSMEAVGKLKQIVATGAWVVNGTLAGGGVSSTRTGEVVEEAGTRTFAGFCFEQSPACRAGTSRRTTLALRLRWRPVGGATQLSSDGVERNYRALASGEPTADPAGQQHCATSSRTQVHGGRQYHDAWRVARRLRKSSPASLRSYRYRFCSVVVTPQNRPAHRAGRSRRSRKRDSARSLRKGMFRTRFMQQIVAEFLPPARPQRTQKLIILCDGMPSIPRKQPLMEFLA